MDSREGFIVHASYDTTRDGSRLFLIGRLRGGNTFAVVEDRFRPGFYVRKSDLPRAGRVLQSTGGTWEDSPYHAMDGEGCGSVRWPSVTLCQQAAEMMLADGIRTYEADLRYSDQFLIDRRIHGSLLIRGSGQKGRRVDHVFINPDLEPSDWRPELSVLSLDIETDGWGKQIYCIGMAFRSPGSGEAKEEVLFSGEMEDTDLISTFPDEKTMLEEFCARIADWDPDILTGWNVIDFDLKIIGDRIRSWGIPFQVGRSDRQAAYLLGEGRRSNTVIIPGRQVVDAARVVRAAPERFSDYTLETVASSVLGRGKKLERMDGESKVESIRRLYRENPESLCLYCMEDAKLVIDILDETGLLDLTVRRCMLIGVGLDRAWTSIAAFDHIYIEAMHERNTVAPTLGVDVMPTAGAPGGAILGPQSGLYDNVWLFDFKSLYPSIILTFNIDPLSHVTPHEYSMMEEEERNRLVETPNGARFRRDPAILPGLLQRFFESRDEAKKRGDAIASFVYKIIMNSFYGVLGAAGSRFASGYLAGAITSMGQYLLHWCENALLDSGYRVVYGDTDSLFALSGLPENTDSEAILRDGTAVCERINRRLSDYIEGQYGLTPHLELEFEKIYYRFFLPPMRSSSAASEANSRGRAKGYAGLTLPAAELKKMSSEALATEPRLGWIDIKGMEAVRRDWTDLAQGFQVGLLELAFRDAGINTVKLFVQGVLADLRSGRLDKSLVYRKALRKPVSEYTRALPPHVKAAAMLAPEEQMGLIEYILTLDGPQPAARLSAPIDYEHYVEKQLKPIARGFEEVLKTDVESLFGEGKQLELF